jgi:uncharacterized protein (TIGR01777 family)
MQIAVTGASGLIGSALVPALGGDGHDVIRLVRGEPAGPGEVAYDPAAGTIDDGALQDVEAIVHLAGENIGTRWTAAVRQRVLDSRVQGTRLVAETAARLPRRPALVCASAIGYYGVHGDELLDETSRKGTGFLADVVEAWEAAAEPARAAGLRVVHLRQGIVLSRHGGALERLLLPFRFGVGGPIGRGRQWWSWVAMDDIVAAYRLALAGPLSGAVNVTSPNPVTNRDFAKALGRALHRPAFLPTPGLALRAVFGDMAQEMLLGGQRVLPAALERAGFAFAHPGLDEALQHALAG